MRPQISSSKAFVDFQNDVTAKDIVIAAHEGFRSIEHVKRYTTTGMATDQGKTSNLNVLAMVADLTNQPVPQVGHTTFRMPYTPVTFGALAGSARDGLFEPVRRTPIHDWSAAHGAVFESVGTWQRARWFPHSGEDMHRSVARECRACAMAASSTPPRSARSRWLGLTGGVPRPLIPAASCGSPGRSLRRAVE